MEPTVERLKLAVLLLLSGSTGAAVMWLLQGHSISIIPSAMSYGDFVAILLTAISTLVAVIAIALAIFALWGWSEFRKGVETKISEITPGYLAKELMHGASRQVLDDLVIEFFRTELAKPGVAEAWAKEKERRLDELKEVDDDPAEE
jgi:hypothetical protein